MARFYADEDFDRVADARKREREERRRRPHAAGRNEAAKLVREGVSVSLARDLNMEKEIDNPDPFRHTMTLGADAKFNMDTYTVNFHGFAFAHIDALSHTYYKDQLYNGLPDKSITEKGASVLDTAVLHDGILVNAMNAAP